MRMGQEQEKKVVFQAPALFVAVFYALLLAWTVGTAPLVYQKFQQGGLRGDWLYAAMFAFFYFFTWFWSMGLFYAISLDPEGQVVLKSFRRRLELPAKQVRGIEGSRFSGGFGFVRFKLPKESAYLFCYRRTAELDEIIAGIRKRNPLLKAARI